ncbi:MAG: EamA family transporter [Gemmatimonadaceae bacterium]
MSSPSPARATLLVLLAACCFGSVVILTALAERAGATLTTLLFWRYVLGGVALASTALAFVAFLRGLAVLGPVRTAIVSTVEPFWTTLLAVAVLGQLFRPATLVGGAMIAAAVLILQRRPPAADRADVAPAAPGA